MLIENVSRISGKTHQMDLPVTIEQIHAFEDGAHVQDAFPDLTPAQREFILTGITSEEWREAFGDEDEEPEDGE